MLRLTIDPTAPLLPSTRYRDALTSDLASRTAGLSFAFVHQPLAVDGIIGVESDALVPNTAPPLYFNQPGAAGRCRRALPAHRPLKTQTQYQLTVDGLVDTFGSSGTSTRRDLRRPVRRAESPSPR